MRLLLALVVLLPLAACSSTATEDDATDPLTESLARATTEVPGFGGVAFEGDRPLVFTLGDEPAAVPVARSIFGAGVVVRERPAVGRGSELLKREAARVLLGSVDGAQSTDYDETTGYVRLGVVTAEAVREAHRVMATVEFPASDVIVQVEGRTVIL